MILRLVVASLLAAGVVTGPAEGASAEDWIDRLPDASGVDLSRLVHDIRPSVADIRPRVEDLVTRDAASQVVTVSSDVLFDFDEAAVRPAAKTAVAKAVSDLPRGAAIAVAGHTDGRGTAPYNQKLSADRAEAVANLIRTARPDLTLTVQGFGSTRPVKPEGGENDAAARAANRRVEIRQAG